MSFKVRSYSIFIKNVLFSASSDDDAKSAIITILVGLMLELKFDMPFLPGSCQSLVAYGRVPLLNILSNCTSLNFHFNCIFTMNIAV